MGNFYIVLIALPRATAVYRSCLTWICWVGIISNANMILKKVCLSKNKLNLLFNYSIYAEYLGRLVLQVCTTGHQFHQESRAAVLPGSINSTLRSVYRYPHNKPMLVWVRKNLCSVWTRGDSMILDFLARRPLPVRNYVVPIKGGPKRWNHVSKVWRLLVWRNETDEKLDMKISFFVIILPNMNSPNFW